MPARKTRYFRVIYYDRDAKTCGISDIISDDAVVETRTTALRSGGREVNISTTTPETDISQVPSIEQVSRRLPEGYRHDPLLSW